MNVRDEVTNTQGIICDTCQKPAPPQDEILKSHGLIRMGWYCSGGTHICETCPHPRTPEQIQADRERHQPRKTDRFS